MLQIFRVISICSASPLCVTGIEGDFDLCQSMVKKAFQDQNLATWLSENGNFRLRYKK